MGYNQAGAQRKFAPANPRPMGAIELRTRGGDIFSQYAATGAPLFQADRDPVHAVEVRAGM